MNLLELVAALRGNDVLAARQWVADAARARLQWAGVPEPRGLDAEGRALAAGLAEMLAARAGQPPPPWADAIGAAPADLWLVRSAASMPRLRTLCEAEGPEPLRRRRVFAPPEFLSFA